MTAGVTVACICLALGVISAVETRHVSVVHGFPLDWSIVVASTMPRWLLMAIALPFVLRLATRFPLVPWNMPYAALHAAVFLALSFAHATIDTWALTLASPQLAVMFAWTARVMRAWYSAMPVVVSLYGAVAVAAWGMAESRERQQRTLRASQLETLLQSARLAALRAQLQPHFLYNTLNGIAALVSDVQPARAVAAIEQLGELLHASLRDDGRDEITIDEEITLAERYLALQAMRFEDRLRYECRIAPGVGACTVPVFLLQPIVENAVVHGLDSGQESLTVRIGAIATSRGVELIVENDGSELSSSERSPAGQGVGIAATRARLETAYGDRASLEIDSRVGGGVIVRMVVPASKTIVAAPPVVDRVLLAKVS